MSADCQGTKRRKKNIGENFNRLSRVNERYRQTDDRRTGDSIIANVPLKKGRDRTDRRTDRWTDGRTHGSPYCNMRPTAYRRAGRNKPEFCGRRSPPQYFPFLSPWFVIRVGFMRGVKERGSCRWAEWWNRWGSMKICCKKLIRFL